MSAEGRAKLSAGRKGRANSEAAKAKISAALKGRSKTPEHVAKVAAAQRGKSRPSPSEETREKQRQTLLAKGLKGRNHHNFGRTPAHLKRIEYNGCVYRSGYEVRFAQMLDRQGVAFQYEPKRFDLGETTYLPDFYLPSYDLYCEVKGYMIREAQRKIELFADVYPTQRLAVIPRDFFKMQLDY
jgi:hypothetical protein